MFCDPVLSIRYATIALQRSVLFHASALDSITKRDLTTAVRSVWASTARPWGTGDTYMARRAHQIASPSRSSLSRSTSQHRHQAVRSALIHNHHNAAIPPLQDPDLWNE